MIYYPHFEQVDPDTLMRILNSSAVRRHLVEHPLFTHESIRSWMNSKIEIGARDGCYVRGVRHNDVLAGWCGIQNDQGVFDLGIVLSKESWGIGPTVFRHLRATAYRLGHESVSILLPESRRQNNLARRRFGGPVSVRRIADLSFNQYTVEAARQGDETKR